MTTPIAERVAGPSHGRALSGDLSPVAIRRLTPHQRMAAVPLLKPPAGDASTAPASAWSAAQPSTSGCRDLKGLNGKAHGHPCGQPPFQWMNLRDPLAPELKRHPGACGLVGSGAVENHLPGSKELRFVLVDSVGRQPATPRDGIRRGRPVEPCSDIDDRDVLPGVEPPL